MRRKTIALAATLVVTLTAGAIGHDGSGALTLEPRPSVGGVALGQTGLTRVGVADGFGSNPACLPRMPAPGIALARSSLIDGIASSVTSIWAAAPLGRPLIPPGEPTGSTFGIGLGFEHVGLELSQGSGWSSETVSLGFGYSAAAYASAGLLVKYLFSSSDIAGTEATAFGIDLGGRIELAPGVDLGLAVRNLLGNTSWDGGQDETPPFTVAVGGAVATPYGTTTEWAVIVTDNEGTRVGAGVEVPLMRTGFLLRGGYHRHSDDYSRNVVSAGFGFKHLRYRMAYAVRIDDEIAFGTTHHFSLGTDFR
jgi:hypothetical protein